MTVFSTLGSIPNETWSVEWRFCTSASSRRRVVSSPISSLVAVKRRTSKHGVVRNDYLMQEVGTSAGPDSESGGPDVCFQRLERPSVTDGSFRPASAVKLSSVFRHGLVKGKAMRDRRVGLHHPQLGEIGVTTSHRAVGCRLTALSDHHISTNPVFL